MTLKPSKGTPAKGAPAKGSSIEGERPKGRLSAEDRALWDHVTREAKPLAARPVLPDPGKSPLPSGPAVPLAVAKPSPAARARLKSGSASGALLESGKQPVPPPKQVVDKRHGELIGVDRARGERLRRGRLPIEGRLDLHGQTQVEAHDRLNGFLASAQSAGKRCVLVVTGKGRTKEGGGVLKVQVPRWLNQAPNRDRVLAFDLAQPKDGGDGALYVLLRRIRRD